MTILTFWLLCAGVTAFIASQRGLPVGKFALIGLLTGLIGVVVACVAPTTPTGVSRAAKNAADYDRRAAMSRPIQRKGL